ncbi:MAG: type II toxin-antitoxin system YafQ family toxin [Selenomonas sp.]|nr:type II toxin-antitoxin system YafQ family toxin [Selenomonas sp.]
MTGDFAGYRECHVQPDWLLVYRIDKEILTLVLAYTGTHSDLF